MSVATIQLRRRPSAQPLFVLVDEADLELLEGYVWYGVSKPVYAARFVAGEKRPVYMHKEILGVAGDTMVDHINGNRLDNRRSNLRLATPALNAQNLRPRRGCSSQYRGVSWDRANRRWRAEHRLDGRSHYLGSFRDEQDAARAAAEFRRVYMPFSEEALSVR